MDSRVAQACLRCSRTTCYPVDWQSAPDPEAACIMAGIGIYFIPLFTVRQLTQADVSQSFPSIFHSAEYCLENAGGLIG